MRTATEQLSLLITSIAGWMNQHQHRVINYLIGSRTETSEELEELLTIDEVAHS